jgi:protein arginine N-methyltransferase 1
VYSIAAFGQMIADEGRMNAYSSALQHAIRPNSIVLDIGAGTGILSLLACQFGARKVYAVEPNSAIGLAEETARANGFADRIEFIQALSTEICLPEKADVIVSDLRGVLPLLKLHLPSIIDARRRLLAPGGNLIPKRDVLWAAIVETPTYYDRLRKPWLRERFDLNMEAAFQAVTNVLSNQAGVTPDQLLSEPHRWATIDYFTVESSDVSAEMTFQITRPGTAHGLLVWFDAVLDEGIKFSNAPGQPQLIYGSGFFPWSYPVRLTLEDMVSVNLRADLVGSDYVWSWETAVHGRHTGSPNVHFRQSTFLGTPLSPAELRKRGSNYHPSLKPNGEVDLHILQLMDGTRSNEEIADIVVARFQSCFQSTRDALTRITDLVEKYSH